MQTVIHAEHLPPCPDRASRVCPKCRAVSWTVAYCNVVSPPSGDDALQPYVDCCANGKNGEMPRLAVIDARQQPVEHLHWSCVCGYHEITAVAVARTG